jgi:hypothetical protein
VPGRWRTISKILFKAGKGEVPGDKGKPSELKEGGIKPGFRIFAVMDCVRKENPGQA